MMGIIEFLEARIAEDEAAVEPLQWAIDNGAEWDGLAASGEYPVMEISPSRVLAECKAKRAILELHGDNQLGWAQETEMEYFDGGEERWDGKRSATMEVLQIMAAVYSDHPDFDRQWAL